MVAWLIMKLHWADPTCDLDDQNQAIQRSVEIVTLLTNKTTRAYRNFSV